METMTEQERIESAMDEPRLRAERHLQIERYAREHGLEYDESCRILTGREQAAEVLPEKLQLAQRKTAQAAQALERCEAEEQKLAETANTWNGLLARWEQQSTLVVQCEDRAELNEAIATSQAELDVVRQSLGDQTREAALFGQLIQAERRARAYRRCAGVLREELQTIEVELVQFAKRNGVEPACLPKHLQGRN